MPTLTLTPTTAHFLARGALAAVSRDAVTPIVTGAELSMIDASHVQLIATDRYRIHRVAVELAKPTRSPIQPVILPDTLLRWLMANARYYNRRKGTSPAEIRLALAPTWDRVTASVEEAGGGASVSWSGPTIRGNFPPVGRLIDAAAQSPALSAPQAFNLDFWASARALGKKVAVKYTEGTRAGVPGPALLTFPELPEGMEAEALIQPYLDVPGQPTQ